MKMNSLILKEISLIPGFYGYQLEKTNESFSIQKLLFCIKDLINECDIHLCFYFKDEDLPTCSFHIRFSNGEIKQINEKDPFYFDLSFYEFELTNTINTIIRRQKKEQL